MQELRSWGRRAALGALATTTIIFAGCGGGGGGGAVSEAVGSPNPANPGANKPPTITAAPVQRARVDASYSFTPAARDEDGDTLAFSITNKPAWATFNTATGQLAGTPRAEHVGSYDNVVITVSDGRASASLPFSITVVLDDGSAPDGGAPGGGVAGGGAVSLSWDVPTTTVDGELIQDLAGYRIHYGLQADQLTEVIDLPSAGLNQYVVQNLGPGTYYFAVRAYTASGAQSDVSNVVSRRIG